MRRESIEQRRLWAWLAVAMSAPLAHFSGGSWLTLGILGVLCGGLIAGLPEYVDLSGSRFLCLLELAWIVLLLGQLMPLSALYWRGEKSGLVVPAVLLALGAYGCERRGSRTAGVLFWIAALLYAPAIFAGARDLRPRWLVPATGGISWWTVPVLLLPACGSFLPVGKRAGKGWYWGVMLFGLALWLVTAGVLSPAVASALETPFHTLSSSLTLGAAGRFESLLSVAVTLGWYGLSSLLIRWGSVFARALGVKEKTAPWAVALAAVLLSWTGVQQKGVFGAVFSLFLWVLVPMLHAKKISKKSEKSA